MSVEGTGKRAIVIAQPRPWSVPNKHNTAAFPLVQIDCYADVTRDVSGRPAKEDAEERALALAAEVRKVMHVPRGAEMEWGSGAGKIRVVSSVAGQDPALARMEDSEVARARSTYEVTLG